MKFSSNRYTAALISFSGTMLTVILLWYSEAIGGFGLWAGILVIMCYVFVIWFLSATFLRLFLMRQFDLLILMVYEKRLSKKEHKKLLGGNNALSNIRKILTEWNQNKALEIGQLKQTEKYRKEFLGDVSHELKTPIFNIQGYILTLLDGGLEDTSINRLYLERSEKSINRMIHIVEDLESISRLESGELELNIEPFDMERLIEEIFELLEMEAKEAKIKLLAEKKTV